MRLYGLRLLVAIFTFAAGVAASSLLSFSSPAPSERHLFVMDAPVLVAAPLPDVPPPHECPNARPFSTISGGVLNGKAVSKPMPAYPPAARSAGVQGTVVVQIVVDEDGDVASAHAVSGPEPLRDAAADAALRARFSPTRLSGQPIKVSGVVTYNFILE